MDGLVRGDVETTDCIIADKRAAVAAVTTITANRGRCSGGAAAGNQGHACHNEQGKGRKQTLTHSLSS
jgi:hypothetical protein